MTKMSGILKVLAFSAVLLIAASSVSVFSVAILGIEDKELTEDGVKGIIALEMPLFVAVAEGSEVSGMRAGTNFLDAEAGISAYTNVGEEIDLEKAKAAFRTVEYETDEYIIGSVPLPDYPEDEDVHAYVHKDGWVVAYYLEEEPVAKIVDWEDYGTDERITGTKLEDGVSVMCNAAGVPIRDLKYYDFRYQNADKMMIVADAEWGGGTDTFDIKLPSDFVFYERSYSHRHIGSGSYVDHTSRMYIDGNEISTITVDYSKSETNYDLLSPTQLSLDEFHTVKNTVGGGGDAFDAIVLIYREA
nr:hypothetical protein, secreted [uncultured archaeon]